ncbi:MAG: hypothetical protein L0212_09255 [Acidobacteria bacterium]|nr:hypothetical protein [Acidobacteriota bacterium]
MIAKIRMHLGLSAWAHSRQTPNYLEMWRVGLKNGRTNPHFVIETARN